MRSRPLGRITGVTLPQCRSWKVIEGDTKCQPLPLHAGSPTCKHTYTGQKKQQKQTIPYRKASTGLLVDGHQAVLEDSHKVLCGESLAPASLSLSVSLPHPPIHTHPHTSWS